MKDIYEECPTYEKKHIILRQTNMEDAQELLKCYSDEKAVTFFNSDNCHGDDFHYTTIERMRKTIDFWDFSYKNKYFIRWTVILKNTNEKIGTIEMFHRIAEDEFNHYGILRIDLQSKYEIKTIIEDILEIVNENFYKAFEVEAILTKAIPAATERIEALREKGYDPLNKKLMIYEDYFINKVRSINAFDDYAKNWDTDKRIHRAKIIADKISNSIDIHDNYSAMEFGSGTGVVSFNLYSKFKQITLIDSSEGMIDILNSKINNYKINNMATHHLDITRGDSLNMKFDVIYNSMVMHHIENIEEMLKNFYELLNKDGYLCIVDLDKEDGSFHKEEPNFHGHNGFNQEELRNSLAGAGFTDIESNTFYYDEKIVQEEKLNIHCL